MALHDITAACCQLLPHQLFCAWATSPSGLPPIEAWRTHVHCVVGKLLMASFVSALASATGPTPVRNITSSRTCWHLPLLSHVGKCVASTKALHFRPVTGVDSDAETTPRFFMDFLAFLRLKWQAQVSCHGFAQEKRPTKPAEAASCLHFPSW